MTTTLELANFLQSIQNATRIYHTDYPKLNEASDRLLSQAAKINALEAVCLNALWHHQGASSLVGQPIRKVLGVGQFDRLTDAHIKTLKNALQEMQP